MNFLRRKASTPAADELSDEIQESVADSLFVSDSSPVSYDPQSIVSTQSPESVAASSATPKRKRTFFSQKKAAAKAAPVPPSRSPLDPRRQASRARAPLRESQSVSGSDDEHYEQIIAVIGRSPRPLPLLGRLPGSRQTLVAVGVAGVMLVSSGLTAAYGMFESNEAQRRVELSTTIEMLTQRLLAATQYAVVGGAGAIDRVAQSRDELREQLRLLTEGDTLHAGLPLASSTAMTELDSNVRAIGPSVDRIVALAASLKQLDDINSTLEVSTRRMYLGSEQLITLMQANGSLSIQISALNHIKTLSERLRRNGSALLLGSSVRPEALSELQTDTASIRATIKALTAGDERVGMPPVTVVQEATILSELNKTFTEDFARALDFLEKNSRDIVTARQNQSQLAVDSERARVAARALTRELAERKGESILVLYAAGVLGVLAIGCLALGAMVSNRATRLDAWETAFKNMVNEHEIIKLMTAVKQLEDRDLTVSFTSDLRAMDRITGGLRSSVDEAVSAIRKAVETVKKEAEATRGQVLGSVEASRALEASNESQAREIGSAGAQVRDLTGAIESVATSTASAADVAHSTKDASNQGAHVVAQTNEKMAEIRQVMQDVLKAVKHLGETSSEISQIVEDVDQITDLTQVLALNASLEAAKAGAAGQGFLVLADEVSRLATRSETSLRTITALVSRIQGETAQAIRTVEDSVSSVVSGAQLAEAADAQLRRISVLADQMSELMQQIQSKSTAQASSASSVRSSMDKLQGISQSVERSVAEMATAVRRIDTSMQTLDNTVGKFVTDARG